jgi:ATP synthase protein I
MGELKATENKGVFWIIKVQVASVVVAVLVVLILQNGEIGQGMAVAYGGFSTVLGTCILAWRINRSVKAVTEGKGHAVLYLYLGAIERFLYTVLLFGIGLLLLKMAILPMIVGLIAGQVGFFLGGLKSQN